jgi:hypothetical protein
VKHLVSILAVLCLCATAVAQDTGNTWDGKLWNVTTVQKIRGGPDDGQLFVEQGAALRVGEYKGARFFTRVSAYKANESASTNFGTGVIALFPVRGAEKYVDFGMEIALANNLSKNADGTKADWASMLSFFANLKLHDLLNVQPGIRIYQDEWGQFMNRAAYGVNFALDLSGLPQVVF